ALRCGLRVFDARSRRATRRLVHSASRFFGLVAVARTDNDFHTRFCPALRQRKSQIACPADDRDRFIHSRLLIFAALWQSRLMPASTIQIIPVPGLPEIRPGDEFAGLIANHLRQLDFVVSAGDVFVVAQKIVSKAEGRVVSLNEIVPSQRATEWAQKWDKDARVIELVLRESKTILRMERGIIVSETKHGFICANAGVDASNTAENTAVLLPENPDQSAQELQYALERVFYVRLGV